MEIHDETSEEEFIDVCEKAGVERNTALKFSEYSHEHLHWVTDAEKASSIYA